MLTVSRISDPYTTENPVTKEKQRLVNVVFIEKGRGTANRGLDQSSQYLSSLIGEQIGLQGIRSHTEPVLEKFVSKFKVHKEFGGISEETFPGHIIREMHSMPVISQQEGKPPQNVDGQPTYFKTTISQNIEDDKDFRISREELIKSPIGQKLLEAMFLKKTEVSAKSNGTNGQDNTNRHRSLLQEQIRKDLTNVDEATMQMVPPE